MKRQEGGYGGYSARLRHGYGLRPGESHWLGCEGDPSVPCCQHELNRQIDNETLKPILGYGLIKERMAALVTDALRAQYLEHEGYDTQILEFIDMSIRLRIS